ncbi:MAG: FixH family protein [Pyrinomonadaceae bacterium]
MNFKSLIVIAIFAIALFIGACSSGTSTPTSTSAETKSIGQSKTSDTVVTLANADGKLKKGKQNLTLRFQSPDGKKPLEIKSASLNFKMPAMGSMAEMNNSATLTTTNIPGEFNASFDIEMPGEWIAEIAWEGQTNGKTTITVNAN